MKTISAEEAFAACPPSSHPVLCRAISSDRTELILLPWFTWLNTKRQPMLSFSLERTSPVCSDLKRGDTFYLAFLPDEIALNYREGYRTAEKGVLKRLPESVELMQPEEMPLQVPAETRYLFRCGLSHAYNYPFSKTRIFNCDLSEACEL